MSADNPKFSDGTPIFPNRGSAEPVAPPLDPVEWLRLRLMVAMTTWAEKPEAERPQFLKVLAGSLFRGIVARAPQGDPPEPSEAAIEAVRHSRYCETHRAAGHAPRDDETMRRIFDGAATCDACIRLALVAAYAIDRGVPAPQGDRPEPPQNERMPTLDDLAQVIHAAWRDGMLAEGRPVSQDRLSWETLWEKDRELDRYIAAKIWPRAVEAAGARDLLQRLVTQGLAVTSGTGEWEVARDALRDTIARAEGWLRGVPAPQGDAAPLRGPSPEPMCNFHRYAITEVCLDCKALRGVSSPLPSGP